MQGLGRTFLHIVLHQCSLDYERYRDAWNQTSEFIIIHNIWMQYTLYVYSRGGQTAADTVLTIFTIIRCYSFFYFPHYYFSLYIVQLVILLSLATSGMLQFAAGKGLLMADRCDHARPACFWSCSRDSWHCILYSAMTFVDPRGV